MTQLITDKILRRAKLILAALLALAAVQSVLLAAVVFGPLPRLQQRQDDLAFTQEGTRAAAVDARAAAESADHTLTSALAALAVPNPQTVHTRAQLDALCRQLLGTDCPPPPTTSTTTGRQ
jgi:hypothetical protein